MNDEQLKIYEQAGIQLVPFRYDETTGKSKPTISGFGKDTYQTPRRPNCKEWHMKIPPGLLILDIDIKNDKDGLSALISKYPGMIRPEDTQTLVVGTKSGGFHIYYSNKTHQKFKSQPKDLPGVEFLSSKTSLCRTPFCEGYKILSGSLDMLLDLELLAPVPYEYIRDFSYNPNPPAPAVTAVNPDLRSLEDRINHVQSILRSRPSAVEGAYGDEHTFKTACIGHNHDIPKSVFFPMLLEWNRFNSPPWTEEELKIKLDSAYSQPKHIKPNATAIKSDGYLADRLSRTTTDPDNSYSDNANSTSSINADRLSRTTTDSDNADTDIVAGKASVPDINKFRLNNTITEENNTKLKQVKQKLEQEKIDTAVLQEEFGLHYSAALKNSVSNLIDFIRMHPYSKEKYAFNEFTHRMEYVQSTLQAWDGIPIDPAQEAVNISLILDRHDVKGIKKHIVSDLVEKICKDNPFNSVVNYFNQLPKWDGVPRIATFFSDYCGSEQTIYTAEVGRLLFCGVASRVYFPGCKFDYMPVLRSGMGNAKQKLLKTIAIRDAWYESSFSDLGNTQKTIEVLSGKLIVEWQDMQGYNKKRYNQYKASITSQVDSSRLAYGRVTERVARKFIFVATTNEDFIMHDPQGNRRDLPIEVNSIQDQAVKEVLPQLYAEAKHLINQDDFMLYITDPEIKLEFKRISNDLFEEDDFTDSLFKWLESISKSTELASSGYSIQKVSLSFIAENWPAYTILHSENKRTRVSQILKHLGYVYKNTRINGKQMKCFVISNEDLKLLRGCRMPKPYLDSTDPIQQI